MRFTDLHTHLLPGVDDGSRSLEETLGALRRFRRAGVEGLAMTPHLGPAWGAKELPRRKEELHAAFAVVCEAVAGRDDLPAIRLGQEVFTWDAAQSIPLLEDPQLGYAGSDFMLVEFGFDLGGRPEEVLGAAAAAGRRVIVAHPERYRFSADPLATLHRWRERGAFLQVNLGSLVGYYDRGGALQHLSWRILEEGLAHVLSSDDHGENRPQTYHREIYAKLVERGGAEQAALLLGENPARVLRGEPPLEVAPLPACSLADAAA